VRARWLSPSLGTFLSADPEPGSPSSPRRSTNTSTAGANPAGFADPTGRFMTYTELQGAMFTAAYIGTNVLAVSYPYLVRRADVPRDDTDVRRPVPHLVGPGEHRPGRPRSRKRARPLAGQGAKETSWRTHATCRCPPGQSMATASSGRE